MTVESDQVGGIYGRPGAGPTGDHDQNSNNVPTNIVVALGSSDSVPASDEHHANLPNNSNITTDITKPPANNHGEDDDKEDIDVLPIPKRKSIAHHHIKDESAVFLSLDLQHAGEIVGIIQLSAEIF